MKAETKVKSKREDNNIR